MRSPTLKSTETPRGNSFRAFSQPDAALQQLKTLLAAQVTSALDAESLTVRKAAEATGIAASDFSRIRTGKLERFTVDRLMTILKRLDREVEVAVTARPQSATRPAMDPGTAAATTAFLARLRDRYAVKESILFGSRARQTHRTDSDADLAIVLSGKAGNRTATAKDLAGIAFDVLLDTGVLIEALPLWEGELEHPERFSNPALIHNIRREGLRL